MPTTEVRLGTAYRVSVIVVSTSVSPGPCALDGSGNAALITWTAYIGLLVGNLV